MASSALSHGGATGRHEIRTPILKDHLMIDDPLGKVEAFVAAG
jgi:hypothetical protein